MDILLIAPKDEARNTAVSKLIAVYKKQSGKKNIRIAQLSDIVVSSISINEVLDWATEGKPDVVVFDGGIVGADDLSVATAAMKQYRESEGRDVLAIYAATVEDITEDPEVSRKKLRR